MRRVVLIGFMGAGKTTVGLALAKLLGWRFRDLDGVIEERENLSIGRIFAERGEAAFRQAETAALRDLLQERPAAGDLVLALGGGAFVQEENRLMLEEAGAITVLLEAPLEELQRRCRDEQKVRPLAGQESDFAALTTLQKRLLQKAASLLKPGGMLVYCTCSLEPEEGEAQIAALLAADSAFRRIPIAPGEVAGLSEIVNAEGDLRTQPCHLPHSDARLAGLDGFYAARLVKA